MKKILILAFSVVLLSSAALAALPASLEMNVTVSYFSLSADGTNYTQIMGTPATINLLDSSVASTTGTNLTITAPPAGTYKYLKMGITSIKFAMGGEEREVLPILKAQSGGNEDWDAMVVTILPTTYVSGALQLNIYMPESNISGNSLDTYFPDNAPVFTFTGDNVSVDYSQIGTANVSIASGITAGNKIFLGAFQSFAQQGAPAFTATMANADDGSASGTMYLPPGDWYLMAIEQSGSMTKDGPPVGSKGYTVGGVKPWEGSPTATTITGQATTDATLAYAFTITSIEGTGGGGKAKGTGSIDFTASVAYPITLSASTPLMAYAYSSTAAFQAGGAPSIFLGANQADAGSFSSLPINSSGLPAGTYVAVFLLDVDGNGSPSAGDYMGAYGGLSSPTEITLTDGQSRDLTGTPVVLTAYQSP